jgi:hypothetical protein
LSISTSIDSHCRISSFPSLAQLEKRVVKMPLGIIEDYKLEHVPGTAPLSDLGRLDTEVSGVDPSMLKHDPSGKIVLVPQPSDSINDPYNWPKMKKFMFAAAFAYGCGCVGGKGSV